MKTKQILSIILMLVLCLCCFAGCAKEEEEILKTEKTVMHLSLNPEVEVVLDEQDKVVAVNAINEEGNLIISDPAFEDVEGKSAEEVARLFVQVSKETGYLVTGNVSAGENEISISISGDGELAKKLFENVNAQVEIYLSSENITASLRQAEAVTDELLRQELAECAPYIPQEQLDAMDHKQLVEELAKCRLETAQMYSQQLKLAYYEAKNFALEQAKMEAMKAHLSNAKLLAYDLLNKSYTTAVELVETVRMEMLISEDSAYQRALAEVRARKVAFLAYRNELASKEEPLTEQEQARLDELEARLNEAEASLEELATKAHERLDEAKAAMTQVYTELKGILDEIDEQQWADEISQKQTAALDSFFTAFESNYAEAEAAAKRNWDSMREQTQIEAQA